MVAAEGFRLHALTVWYGQRHSHEIKAARGVAGWLKVVRHIELDVELSAFGRIGIDDRRTRAPRS